MAGNLSHDYTGGYSRTSAQLKKKLDIFGGHADSNN
jgi:hypothetical protein